VVHARNLVNDWIGHNRNIIFPILAFAIPAIVRVIPEILMGQFLVGFDSIAYYVPNTLIWLKDGVNFWAFVSDAPLIYVMLMGIASTGASIVVSIKILSPLLLGILGLAVYYYAFRALSWSQKKSLLVVLLATLYFVALRISWDLLRSELGLIFLFLALIILQKKGFSFKNGVLLSCIMAIIVFTHQLVAVIAFAIVIAIILRLVLDKKKNEVFKLIAYSIPAALLFISVIYLTYFVSSVPTMSFSRNFSMGFESLAAVSYSDLVVNTFGFLAFCYLPLLPFLVFGVRRLKSNIQLKAWIIWSFIPILFVLVPNVFIGGVLPYRWILMLTYPLAFYAAEGFSAIKWNWYKIGVATILIILSVSFFASPNNYAASYYGNFPSYVPKSMLQNTVPLSDCQDTVNALVWAQNNMPNNANLLVHQAFYGWATLTININRLIYYGFNNPVEMAQNKSSSSNVLYLIWWVNGTGWYGQPNLPESFIELYHSGNIAVYNYSVTS
jgi:hypothetical protein